jgi:hypothetical protein
MTPTPPQSSQAHLRTPSPPPFCLLPSYFFLLLSLLAFSFSSPPPALAADLDLRRASFTGSLARTELFPMLRDLTLLQVVEAPPHDLIVTWTNPVTIAGHEITWESPTLAAAHYGLEYWDAPAARWQLLYETTSNNLDTCVHRFPAITTSRVRFTVFLHPMRYYGLSIRHLRLLAPDAAPATQALSRALSRALSGTLSTKLTSTL